MKRRKEIPAPRPVDLLRMSKKSIESNGCRIWTGAIAIGYGVMYIDRKPYYVHRVAAAWKGLDVSDPETVVRHKCNNRLCFADDHLLVGTHADNARDREEAGRHYVPAGDPLQPG
jgi:hypothetical protein